jgi:hypothetical protein
LHRETEPCAPVMRFPNTLCMYLRLSVGTKSLISQVHVTFHLLLFLVPRAASIAPLTRLYLNAPWLLKSFSYFFIFRTMRFEVAQHFQLTVSVGKLAWKGTRSLTPNFLRASAHASILSDSFAHQRVSVSLCRRTSGPKNLIHPLGPEKAKSWQIAWHGSGMLV